MLLHFELHEKFIDVQCVIPPHRGKPEHALVQGTFLVHCGCVTQSCVGVLSSCTLLHLHVFDNSTKAASSGLLLVDTVVSNVANYQFLNLKL